MRPTSVSRTSNVAGAAPSNSGSLGAQTGNDIGHMGVDIAPVMD